MINLPDHLKINEQQAVLRVCLMLSETLGDNLVDLFLFGSKARGDSHVDSDIDLLIVLHQLDANSRWLARSAAADCSLEYDVLFNTHLYEKGRWDAIVAQRDTLWREVQRDGIPLRDLLAQTIS